MENYYLAVDLGASSGRVIGGYIKDGSLVLEELHRFENGMTREDGSLCWDYGHIFSEILKGLKICASHGIKPVSLGIDTWGVDYVLLDSDGHVLGKTYAYRDGRVTGMDERVNEILSPEELYQRTGLQKVSFNTIYQLMADRVYRPEHLQAARCLLMVPDYLNYLLTGKLCCEYTDASTTQLLKTGKSEWDLELIRMLGFPENIFLPLVQPGTVVGKLKEDLSEEIGFQVNVVTVASHDTASAIAAIPEQGDDYIYISSGTWSLMGVILDEPICTEESRKANLTNEGGYAGKICYLRNLMGLWMIQNLRKEMAPSLSYGEICALAETCEDFPSRIDVNDERYIAPANMAEEIRNDCREQGAPVPGTLGELSSVVYHSLAESYAKVAAELEQLTGRTYSKVMIVGGGSNATFLNRLTEEALGKTVITGLQEATATGNLIVQMLAFGEIKSYEEAKTIIRGKDT